MSQPLRLSANQYSTPCVICGKPLTKQDIIDYENTCFSCVLDATDNELDNE